MTMAPFIPVQTEALPRTPKGDFAFEPIYRTVSISVRVPVIKVPLSSDQKYSDSELATAATMLELLRNGTDRSAPIDAENEALDVVVEKMIDQLQ